MSSARIAPITLTLVSLAFAAPCGAAEPPGKPLPEGTGKPIAQATCLSCHDSAPLASPGHSRGGWENVINQMMNIGATLTPEEVPALADYLAGAFPEQPRAAATIIPGRVQVTFKEWAVATPGAFPHDPLATADGAIWYTGQRLSVLGRIDPTTGAVREYPTPVANSGPHGLIADVAGNVWFTANYAGYIGKLDPKSGAVAVFKLPDPSARDPHTPVFDQQGVLWFTVQGANRVGRLIPRTGQMELATVPTPHALPYGIVVSSTGVPYFAEFGTHQLASIDPGQPVVEPRRRSPDSPAPN